MVMHHTNNATKVAEVNNSIHSALAKARQGFSLPAEFYASDSIFDLEMKTFLGRHWQCVTHESLLPEIGDFVTHDFGLESAIVTRGKDKTIRAFANVCRHRGSRICDKASGRAKNGVFVCPYHAWSYATDGRLISARMFPPEFDKTPYGLKELPSRIVQGLIFIAFDENPLKFDDCEKNIDESLGPYGWKSARVAHRAKVIMNANWKLALENQVECYHCAPAHPEFSVVHAQSRANEAELNALIAKRAGEQGIEFPTLDHWVDQAKPGFEMASSKRHAMKPGVCTASRDGSPIAPLMGDFKQYDEGMGTTYVGPFNHLLTYTDYGALFCYVPMGPRTTVLNITWLVRSDAKEGIDYDLGNLTWLWDITAAADRKIVEQNQLGIDSKFYQPGPYAMPIEILTARLCKWYLNQMSSIENLQ
jgi:phenylpropionate dioxygenase-like ring-hydroxylating dioxygenase large terminal subunit